MCRRIEISGDIVAREDLRFLSYLDFSIHQTRLLSERAARKASHCSLSPIQAEGTTEY